MVQRLQSLGEIAVRSSNRVLVDVDIDLGRVFRRAGVREKWVFSSIAAERAATYAGSFDLFAKTANFDGLRHFVLRPLRKKIALTDLDDGIRKLSDDYDQHVGRLVSKGLIEPILCVIHVRYDPVLGLFDLHAHCIWRVRSTNVDAVHMGIQTKFSTVWMDSKRIRNPASLVNYLVSWVVDHRQLPDWPKDAILALWRASRPRLIRAAGDFAEFRGNLGDHRIVREGGTVQAIPVRKRPARKNVGGASPKTGTVVGFVQARLQGTLRWCAIAAVDGRDRLSRKQISNIVDQSTLVRRRTVPTYPTTTTGQTPLPAGPDLAPPPAPLPATPPTGIPAAPPAPSQPQGTTGPMRVKHPLVRRCTRLVAFLGNSFTKALKALALYTRGNPARVKQQQGP